MRHISCIATLLLVGCVIPHPIDAEGDGEEPTAQTEATEVGSPQQTRPAEGATAATAPAAGSPWREAGRSVQGRPIRMTTVGEGPRQVLWIGAIHGDEQEGRASTAQLADEFLSMRGASKEVTLHMIENLNPDGSALGRRGNANNVDLNRNFPAQNFDSGNPQYGGEPLSQPESRFLHDVILEIRPDLVIVSHAWRGDHFINYDGPAERLAYVFSTLSEYPVRPSESISPTPGSLGSWVGIDLGIPILTLEYERGIDPTQAWQETNTAIIGVILGD